MLIYSVIDAFYDYSKLFIFRLQTTFRFIFLLFMVYILRSGNRSKFEGIFKNVFCCLNVFIFYDFFKFFNFNIFVHTIVGKTCYFKLEDFLNTVFCNLLVDFKLILFDINKRRTRKKCYKAIIFEDLLIEHQDLYVQAKTIKSFLEELRSNIKKRKELRKLKKVGAFRQQRLEAKAALLDPKTRKPLIPILQPISLYPICVTFEYKRLKVFSFLFKSAKLQSNKCIYIRLSREFLMSFFESSLSCYIVDEILEIAMSHKYDIKF